ncbi:hypothetical protein EAG_16121 [Camponotus floridanus]|uniref:Uncharacterized protein n=1 Tax=Camponotus floridanus TaxID=104421 RepID=E2AM32_CAMFO|nr:hypothetical protein EAG_16121 [Camponotus floridanus]
MAHVQMYRMYTGRSFICDKNVLENLIFKTRPTSAKIKLSAMLPGTCLDLHAEKSNAPLRRPLPSPTLPSDVTTVSKSTFPLKQTRSPHYPARLYPHELHLPKQDSPKSASEMDPLL